MAKKKQMPVVEEVESSMSQNLGLHFLGFTFAGSFFLAGVSACQRFAISGLFAYIHFFCASLLNGMVMSFYSIVTVQPLRKVSSACLMSGISSFVQ